MSSTLYLINSPWSNLIILAETLSLGTFKYSANFYPNPEVIVEVENINGFDAAYSLLAISLNIVIFLLSYESSK